MNTKLNIDSIENGSIVKEKLAESVFSGVYYKPDSGIPKSDLDTSVQTSLDKGDAAWQFTTYSQIPDNRLEYSSSGCGDISPIDLAISNVHSANRLALCNTAGVTVEYSNDSGSTWNDYNASNEMIAGILSGCNTGNFALYIGKRDTGEKTTVDDQLRITLDPNVMNIYTHAQKMLLNISTAGATQCKVKVDYEFGDNPGVFAEQGVYDINGWSGWNSFPCNCAFGGTHVTKMRMTFFIGGVDPTYDSRLHLIDMYLVGKTYWITPSTMAKTGHLYDYDYNKNAYFPGEVYSNGNKTLTANDIKTLTIGSKSYNGSANVTVDATDLGLGKVMNYIGKTSTTLSDGSTVSSITVDSKTVNVKQGDVVIDSSDSKEYIWNGSKWEEFGNEGNYKIRQNAVTSPNASGNTTSFIDTISQDENGVITATKKNVSFPTYNNATTAAAGLMSAADKSKLDSVPTSFAPTNAEANVQSDWNATSGDAFIKNKPSLSAVATSGSYNDLTNKPTIPSAVTSSTVSDWGFTKNAGTITGIKMNGASKGSSGVVDLGTVITSLDGYATQSWVEGKGYKTTDNDTKNTAGSSNKTGTKLLIVGATSTTTGTTYTNSNCYVGKDNCLYSGGTKVLTSHQDISGKADKSSLATVATSGSYNDLTNKPTIPSAVTSSTVSGWGFTKNAGTVTGVKINGSTKSPSSGVVDLGTVLTSHQDISGKAPNNHASTATTYGVATSGTSAKYGHVKLVSGNVNGQTYTDGVAAAAAHTHSNYLTSHQDISGKQDKLVSGTNIKTVNSNSLLGSGNISVGTITKVQANGTDVSSSGTANIPAASTSAYGVTKLSSATNSTSTSLAATASAVKAAYDLANGKWTYNADTIKAVKVNNAAAADSASSVAWSGVTSKPTTISGYGITDAYTKSAANGKFITGTRDAYNVNTLYNAGIHMVASGSNVPCGSEYGVCLTLPYRQLYGNSKPDFGAQIFLPNGDDNTKPNSLFFRTSLGDTWNAWQEVATKGSLAAVATSGSYNDLSNKPTIPAAYKGNYSTSALTASSTSFTLRPNTYYTIKPSSASTRTFSFGSATSGIVNEYIVEINMSSYAPTIAFPSSVVWANGTAPEYTKGKKYIISIVNNYAVFAEF